MKYTKLFLIALSILLACSENTNQEPELKSELFKKPILAESLKIYRSNKSIDAVADYLKENFQVDFYKEGEKIKQLNSYFNYAKKRHTGGRINEEISFADIQGLLEAQGYTQTTVTYNYIANVSALFEGGVLSPEQVYTGLVNLRVQIENNYSISQNERFGISNVGQIIENNFYQLIDAISQDGIAIATRKGSKATSWNWGQYGGSQDQLYLRLLLELLLGWSHMVHMEL